MWELRKDGEWATRNTREREIAIEPKAIEEKEKLVKEEMRYMSYKSWNWTKEDVFALE